MAPGNKVLTPPPLLPLPLGLSWNPGRPSCFLWGNAGLESRGLGGKERPHVTFQLTSLTDSHRSPNTSWGGSGLLPASLPLWACALHPLGLPLATMALALEPGGGERLWAFPSSLPSRLETGSVFPGPAPFIRETMCAHSEGLVWHPSPKPFDLRNFSSADLSP